MVSSYYISLNLINNCTEKKWCNIPELSLLKIEFIINFSPTQITISQCEENFQAIS